nr:hypothetical protein [Tanacetum cinerariifolium]
ALEKQIKELNNTVFKRNQSAQTVHMLTKSQFFYDHTTKQALETLMLAEESRSKMLLKQIDPKISEKKVNTTPNYVDSPEPTPSSRPTKVEVPKELPKVSMEDKIKKKLEEIETFNIELDHRVTKIIAENEHLKQTYKKLKEKAVMDDDVPSHPIDPELLKVDVAPLAAKLQNNRTVHSDYLRHTQEETTTLRGIVKQGRSLNPLNTSLDYALGNACPLTRFITTAKVLFRKLIALESNRPKPMVTLVYSRKPKASRNNVLVSKFKNNKSLSANKKEPNKSWGSTVSNVPSSSIDECRLSKLFSSIWTPAAPST